MDFLELFLRTEESRRHRHRNPQFEKKLRRPLQHPLRRIVAGLRLLAERVLDSLNATLCPTRASANHAGASV